MWDKGPFMRVRLGRAGGLCAARSMERSFAVCVNRAQSDDSG